MSARRELNYSKYEWEATVAWIASSLVLITIGIAAIVSTSLFVMEISALILDGCCAKPVSLTILLIAYISIIGIWLFFRRMSIQTHPIKLMPIDTPADLTELGLGLGIAAILCTATITLASLPAWEIVPLFICAAIPMIVIAVPRWITIARIMAGAMPVIAIFIALTAPLSITGAFLLAAPLCALLFIGWTRQARVETIEVTIRHTEKQATALHNRLAAQEKTLKRLRIPRIALADVPTPASFEPANIRALRRMTSIPLRMLLLAAITGSGAAIFTVALDYIVLSAELTSLLAPLGFGSSTTNEVVGPLAVTVQEAHWYIISAWGFSLLVWLLLSLEGASEGRKALNQLVQLTNLTQKLSARADYQAAKIEAVRMSSKEREPRLEQAKEPRGSDHYLTLGIRKNADLKNIREAYRGLAKKYHPDRTGNLSELRMKQINEAYNVLSDAKSRALYDKNLGASD